MGNSPKIDQKPKPGKYAELGGVAGRERGECRRMSACTYPELARIVRYSGMSSIQLLDQNISSCVSPSPHRQRTKAEAKLPAIEWIENGRAFLIIRSQRFVDEESIDLVTFLDSYCLCDALANRSGGCVNQCQVVSDFRWAATATERPELDEDSHVGCGCRSVTVGFEVRAPFHA